MWMTSEWGHGRDDEELVSVKERNSEIDGEGGHDGQHKTEANGLG